MKRISLNVLTAIRISILACAGGDDLDESDPEVFDFTVVSLTSP